MKYLGVGVGLRRPHYLQIFQEVHQIDWFELVSENYMNYGGQPREIIAKLKERNYPLICHGLGLSVGSSAVIPLDYIEALKELLEFTDSPWFSDHLCLSSSRGHQYHDLLPVLKTEEALEAIALKIQNIQEIFQRPFAIENISYYGESSHHTMGELDFICGLLEKTGSYLLLDINNVYVNEQNLKIDSKDFLSRLPHDRVIQIHLAGHWNRGDFVIDTHGSAVCHEVWELYRWYLGEVGRPISTLIEWDNDLPDFKVLNEEVLKAQAIVREVLS